MNTQNWLKLGKESLKALVLSGMLVSALSFVALVITQKNFRATSDLLVVQNQNGFTDYYALSRSAEFLTNVLVEATYSEKFISEVENTKLVSSTFLAGDKIERLKEWENIVKITRNPSLGMIHIEVFTNDQKQGVEISNAIVSVLTNKNFLFLGKGQDLDMRVLNGPIWEKNPSITSIALAVIGGFLVGVLLAIVWVYYKNAGYLNLKPDDYIESLEQLR